MMLAVAAKIRARFASLTTRRPFGFANSCYQATRRLAAASIDLVYPPQCSYCGADIQAPTKPGFCADCEQQLAPHGLVQCPRCAAIVNPAELSSGDCARCRDERFRFERVFALARYEGASREAVLRMKRVTEEPLMMAMGGLLTRRFAEQLAALNVDVVVPIPLHWTRRLARGTNAPELMGEVVARGLHCAFGRRSLRRKRRTRKLAELSRQERKSTLRDAFAVGNGCDFFNARVLLIDDVLTTGTTCDVAARTLLKAGAAAVWVLVAARAYPGD
jgi:ComF family protein